MNYQIIFIILYFIIINILTFILYFTDKRKAMHHRWRIPESTLIALSLLGGSFGAYLAMKIFRHKTKHPKFYITIPLMMILHTALIIVAFVKLI